MVRPGPHRRRPPPPGGRGGLDPHLLAELGLIPRGARGTAHSGRTPGAYLSTTTQAPGPPPPARWTGALVRP
ncbi:protein of unknown function [Streptomyces murinus]